MSGNINKAGDFISDSPIRNLTNIICDCHTTRPRLQVQRFIRLLNDVLFGGEVVRAFAFLFALMLSGCALRSASVPVRPSDTGGGPYSTPWRSLPGPQLIWNGAVQQRFQIYLRQNLGDIQGAVDRLGEYRDDLIPIFDRYGVPHELLYLGIVESWFRPAARSRSGAVGIWQIMKPLAAEYGLSVGVFSDERKDPIKSTEAAAKILLELYREFDDWFLALAAYNAGKYRVLRVLRETGVTDFWSLVETAKLKVETEVFVPKFIALALILKEGKRYGIEKPW